MGMTMKSIVGQKFGMLTAIEFVEMRGKHNAHYVFKCDCGNEKIISASSAKTGNTLSCGCIRGIPDLYGGNPKYALNRKYESAKIAANVY